MKSQSENPDYKTYKSPEKRRNFFIVYLFLFGVILGVFLTNTYISFKTNKEKEILTKYLSDDDVGDAARQRSMKQSSPGVTSALLTDYENTVIAAAQKAKPAVVSIYISGTQYYRFGNPIFDMFYGPQRRELNAMGSGVIIDQDGTVITNEHVIRMAKESVEPKIRVVLSDGRIFDAELVKDLPGQDIAILSIKGTNLPSVEIVTSENVSQGQTVLAIGNPFGMSTGGEPTVTRGIISATKRNLTIPEAGETKYYRNMLQTDASINEGNSGGALIDLNGNLIGINTAILTEGAGSIGIGFAIPADRVKLILENIDKYGDIADVETGIKVQSLTRTIANALNFRGEGGVIISDVEPGKSGEKSGVRKGDIITGINGFSVSTIEQARSLFRDAIPGEMYVIKIFRNGNYLDMNLTLGLRGR